MKSPSKFALLVALTMTPLAASAWQTPQSAATVAAFLVYRNPEFGFCFNLPESWTGFTVLHERWRGSLIHSPEKTLTGPQLILRHPRWTEQHRYEDIPIMVFTPAEWKLVKNDEMIVSAAPIGPTELGHNRRYVFALPPRYIDDFSTGWREVETLMQQHPLTAPCAPAQSQQTGPEPAH